MCQNCQWMTCKEKCVDKITNARKFTNKTSKHILKATVKDLIKVFELKMKLIMAHEARILHQFMAITNLKNDMNHNEVVVHCDSSENCSLKYAEEIQAFHFGGSQQISMHIVVVYSKVHDELRTKCFCTISESLEHNVPAIWGHLSPVLNKILKTIILTLSILLVTAPQASTETKLFSFIANHFDTFFTNVKNITWNYQEAGHGRGAPDGVGDVCKRSADHFVTQGKDITSAKDLLDVLVSSCPEVPFYQVTSQDIELFTQVFKTGSIIPFAGTMKVHQVRRTSFRQICFNSLSCFECSSVCAYYDIGSFKLPAPVAMKIFDLPVPVSIKIFDLPVPVSIKIFDLSVPVSIKVFDLHVSVSIKVFDLPVSVSIKIFDLPVSVSIKIFDLPVSVSIKIFDLPVSVSIKIFDLPVPVSINIFNLSVSVSIKIFDLPVSVSIKIFDLPVPVSSLIFNLPVTVNTKIFILPVTKSTEKGVYQKRK
ncbi:hypothetical protein PR048_029328 [Dryococelus australis]|uniref:Uncharacterized protein n=1 Tax=Dryococelus australis TaxID=614101 RepID=A0ABQ9GD29_9NEOP|nr:hypothetical protein PR048_029328 [Dryococelus australis]